MASEDWKEKEYLDDVASLAVECGNLDCISEKAESSQWVIYHGGALRVMRYSRNESAMFDEGEGLDGLDGCENALAVICRMAYYALVADMYAHRRKHNMSLGGRCECGGKEE